MKYRGLILFVISLMLGMTAVSRDARALEIKRFKLANGATLLVSEEHQLPMLTISIDFDAGSRRDPVGKEGLADLTARCITQGTRTLAADQFNEKVDFMGSSIAVNAGGDNSAASMTSLKRYQADTLALFAGIVSNPGLRDADIERRRAELVAEINANEEQPGYTAHVAFLKMLFDGAPYGHPSEGSKQSVAKLTADDVRSFYRDHYKLGSAVIAATGDLDAQEIKTSLDRLLTIPSGDVAAQPAPAPPNVAAGIHTQIVDRNVAQANIIMGFGGIARANPDFYKIAVMNYILGSGGFSSRLVKEVRSNAGLAYSVGSVFQASKFVGPFAVSLQTKNASANQAIAMILAEMKKIQDAPVSDDELDGAKRFLVGSFPLKIDRQSEIAAFMIQIEQYNLGLDYAERYPSLINSITAADVQSAARTYLHPDGVDLVAVANQAEAKIDAANFTAAPTTSN